MSQPLIVGLTGKRGVGKSEVTKVFKSSGFRSTHGFQAGKVAVLAYYIESGIPESVAHEMVYGSLKDVPSEWLPDRQTSRFFMEKFGRFMGQDMGSDWTLGLELKRIKRNYPHDDLICESIVYEEKQLKAAGALIIRITRPGHELPLGIETDKYESQIVADVTIENSGSLADLQGKIEVFLAQHNR